MNKKTKKRKRIHARHKKLSVRIRALTGLITILVFVGLALLFIAARTNPKIADIGERHNLQLETFQPTAAPKPTFSYTAPVPTAPSNAPQCSVDNGQRVDPTCYCGGWLTTCKNFQCVGMDPSRSHGDQSFQHAGNCDIANEQHWCAALPDGDYCLAKPVIYLYPTKPTFVDVSIVTPGKIVVSDPLYPDGGWKQVLANPNGSLVYNGHNYKELFYESSVHDFGKPTNGISIPHEQLKTKLNEYITRLGLNTNEKTEFLDFWVPRLQDLNAPYILFSVIEPAEKEKVDHVNVNPTPATRIEFIAYFKPLSKPFEGKLLELPSTPPERIGFTMVEWGGVIDNKGL